MLKTLSLFSGSGGFEIACSVVGGFNVTTAIEKNPFRQKVLKKNFPHLKIHDDVTTFYSNEYFDCIIGGFPCKGMSYAGKGEGYKNEHSALWWDMLRIIAECRPRFVIIENVRGFMHRGLRECLGGLRMAGYNFDEPQIVSAKEVGSCNLRERIFVTAYSNRIVWREQPTCWSGQIRSQIEAARGVPTNASSVGQWHSKPEQDRLQGKEWLEKETKRSEQKRSWTKFGRSPVSCGESNPERLQFPSFIQRMDDGFSSELDSNRELNETLWRDGWWLDNPFVGDIAALPKSIRDRQARMSAMGDSVTPQQAAIPLLRVKYLNEIRVN